MPAASNGTSHSERVQPRLGSDIDCRRALKGEAATRIQGRIALLAPSPQAFRDQSGSWTPRSKSICVHLELSDAGEDGSVRDRRCPTRDRSCASAGKDEKGERCFVQEGLGNADDQYREDGSRRPRIG